MFPSSNRPGDASCTEDRFVRRSNCNKWLFGKNGRFSEPLLSFKVSWMEMTMSCCHTV